MVTTDLIRMGVTMTMFQLGLIFVFAAPFAIAIWVAWCRRSENEADGPDGPLTLPLSLNVGPPNRADADDPRTLVHLYPPMKPRVRPPVNPTALWGAWQRRSGMRTTHYS
jgi:hypothetical protein